MKNYFVIALGLWASLSAALPTATSPNEASVVVRDLEARARPACGRKTVDKYLFKTSMKNFVKARKNGLKNKGPRCGWKSNGCTGAPNKIPVLNFNFKPSCDRHDFGYGNYKRLNLRKESHRKTIDKQFLKDLVTECKRYGIFKRTACRLAANEYYKWVRRLGWIFNRDVEGAGESNFWERDEVEQRDTDMALVEREEVDERDVNDDGLEERDESNAEDEDEDDEDDEDDDEDLDAASEEDVDEFMKEFGISLD